MMKIGANLTGITWHKRNGLNLFLCVNYEGSLSLKYKEDGITILIGLSSAQKIPSNALQQNALESLIRRNPSDNRVMCFCSQVKGLSLEWPVPGGWQNKL